MINNSYNPSTSLPTVGRGTTFTRAVKDMTITEDFAFSVASNGFGSNPTVIADSTKLNKYFRPLEGEFDANGNPLGGAGLTTIGNEIERYRTSFDGNNHIFDADGLRLQVTVPNGTFNTYFYGSVLTTGGGLNVNAPGGTTTTAYADIGITTANMASASVGDVWMTSGGMMVLKAFDNVAQTVILEAVTGGTKTAYRGNVHVTGTKFAFGQIATNVTSGTTTTVTYTSALPPQVVPGCFAMWCNRGSYYYDPVAQDRARVLSISADRLTVTFDSPVSFSNSATMTVANNSGTLFIPEIWSAQIWSRKSYGPQRPGKSFQAIRVEFTMPSMPSFRGAQAYTGSAMSSVMSTYSGSLWGYWPAVWLYSWRPGGTDTSGVGQNIVSGYRNSWSELDMLEVFVRPWTGQNQLYCALHDQPYTRNRLSNNSVVTCVDSTGAPLTQFVGTVTAGTPFALLSPCDAITGATGYLIHPQVFFPTVSGTGVTVTYQTAGSRIDSGAYWNQAAANNKEKTPNAVALNMSSSICDGTRKSIAVVWTRDRVIHYFNDQPVCESYWAVDNDYVHQLAMNVAVGSLSSNGCYGLNFPQTTAQAQAMFMKIHSIRTWEA